MTVTGKAAPVYEPTIALGTLAPNVSLIAAINLFATKAYPLAFGWIPSVDHIPVGGAKS